MCISCISNLAGSKNRDHLVINRFPVHLNTWENVTTEENIKKNGNHNSDGSAKSGKRDDDLNCKIVQR